MIPATLLMTPTSPYARKCLLVAMEKGKDLAVSVEPPHAQGSRIGALNPLVKVPTLLLSDGTAVYDSRVIVDVLEMVWPEPALIPAQGRERMEVLRWQALGDGLADAMVLVMMDRIKPEERRDLGWQERQIVKIDAALALINQEVRPGQWLVGERLTLAELAVISGIGYVQLRGAELLANRWPNLHAWSAWLHERPSVAATVPVAM